MADGSAHFRSSSDYVTISDGNNFGSGAYTVELFYSIAELPTTEVILYGNYTTLGNYSVRVALATTGNLSVNLKNNANVTFATVTSAFGEFNRWNHVAIAGQGSNHSVYVNGIGSDFVSNTTSMLAGNTEILGYQTTGSWLGSISNFRVVLGSRVYTANFTVPQRSLTTIANTRALALNDNSLIRKRGTEGYNSIFFDGTGDYITLPSGFNATMGNGLAGNRHTIEAWVRPTSWNSANSYYHAFYGTYKAVAANGRWLIGIQGRVSNQSGRLSFTYTTGTGAQTDLYSSTYNIPLNTWTHVAVTIDATTSSSTTICFFQNGILTDTFTGQNLSTQTTNYTATNIGGNYSAFQNEYAGYISNFRQIYQKLEYTADFTLSYFPLTVTSNTIVLTCQSSTIKDNSTNSFALTVAGQTSANVTIPFQDPTITGAPMSVFSNPFTPIQGIVFQEDFNALLDSAEEIQAWQGSDNRAKYT